MTGESLAWLPITGTWVPGAAFLWHSQGRFWVFQPPNYNYWGPGFTHWIPVPDAVLEGPPKMSANGGEDIPL